MLSEKEKKLVQDPYFQVLRLIEDYDEDYVELKSKCTVHCWTIRRKGDYIVALSPDGPTVHCAFRFKFNIVFIVIFD